MRIFMIWDVIRSDKHYLILINCYRIDIRRKFCTEIQLRNLKQHISPGRPNQFARSRVDFNGVEYAEKGLQSSCKGKSRPRSGYQARAHRQYW
jgi:hypothetical protein